MHILVFNCGSSSIKYKLYAMPAVEVVAAGSVQRIGEDASQCEQKCARGAMSSTDRVADHDDGLLRIRDMLTDPDRGPLRSFDEIGAVGHRVVHGGEKYRSSVIIDEQVIATIEEFSDLAPLHNPPNLTGIRAAQAMAPAIPQIACFDTAFHQTIPQVAHLYALPYDLYEKYRIRRYGFHGTSHRWVSARASEQLGKKPAETSMITCHLGNGCSMAAIKNGVCIDTSLGMTPLEGLVMGTRSGDIDPAIIFYLGRKGYTLDDLDKLLNKQSGLLGVSQLSNDVRDLEEKARGGNARAALALELFAYRVRKYIGSYLAVLNGCHAIVLTGGIGENQATMRARILENLDTLGAVLDSQKNSAAGRSGGIISAEQSPITIMVVPTDEEAAIAADTYELVGKKV